MTLNPGDIVSLGSSPQHSAILPGDTVRIGIDDIGTLENPVIGA